MSQQHTGNVTPAIDNEEHDHLPGGVAVKKVGNYKWNGTSWERDSEKISYAVDKDDASDYYFASYLRDGSWRIEKMSKTTGISTYATGSSGIEENWTNRTTLTYGNL